MNRVSFLPAIGWFICTLILLSLPGNQLPSAAYFDFIPFFDKWVHIGIFLLLVFLFTIPFTHSHLGDPATKSWMIRITFYALGYGIIMEFVQKYLVAYRSFDIVDILCDFIGCMFGYFMAGWYIRHKKIGPDGNRGRNQN